MPQPILPPFTDPAQAAQKVQLAEDLWNTRDPERVTAAYTEDTQWRNRTKFLNGRQAVLDFLRRKVEPRARLQAKERALGLSQ